MSDDGSPERISSPGHASERWTRLFEHARQAVRQAQPWVLSGRLVRVAGLAGQVRIRSSRDTVMGQ